MTKKIQINENAHIEADDTTARLLELGRSLSHFYSNKMGSLYDWLLSLRFFEVEELDTLMDPLKVKNEETCEEIHTYLTILIESLMKGSDTITIDEDVLVEHAFTFIAMCNMAHLQMLGFIEIDTKSDVFHDWTGNVSLSIRPVLNVPEKYKDAYEKLNGLEGKLKP